MRTVVSRALILLVAGALSGAITATAKPIGKSALDPAIRVLSVRVEGNQQISTNAILQVVATKPGEAFSREQLDRDVSEIHHMGWFRAEPTTRVENTPDGVKVTLIVQEWPVIQKIETKGNKLIPTAQLRAAVQTKEGNVPGLLPSCRRISRRSKSCTRTRAMWAGSSATPSASSSTRPVF